MDLSLLWIFLHGGSFFSIAQEKLILMKDIITAGTVIANFGFLSRRTFSKEELYYGLEVWVFRRNFSQRVLEY